MRALAAGRVVATVSVVLLAAAGVAEAQVVHSFDDLIATGRLKPGDKVTLRGPLGQEAQGEFRGWRVGSLELFIADERRHATFAEADVRTIRRAPTHAAAWGAAIGGASAAAVTAAAAASYGENEGGRFCGGCFVQWGAIAIPAGVGIGAGIGFAIDRLRQLTIFEALPRSGSIGLAPVVSRRAAGLRVSVQF